MVFFWKGNVTNRVSPSFPLEPRMYFSGSLYSQPTTFIESLSHSAVPGSAGHQPGSGAMQSRAPDLIVDATFGRPFRAHLDFDSCTQGVALGWDWVGPLAHTNNSRPSCTQGVALGWDWVGPLALTINSHLFIQSKWDRLYLPAIPA